ncbi:MAG: glycine--tRNA ligase [Candidatus Komeilibacteria bacterium RIFCSPLOWO2_01_FULL_45_10]|uniref:Glycine--tRNA ligase n=1 Tax=Candidatus Komeilibacteria bacterium RIFCSPLOWO2_01_FULL_45_10 TaxID=1798550 RepID=A0A1G2BI43_9BACT|nr:MAG: glycine--tRNA ligase [Candidatus Komeilibacteria bacterium RIFCSPLOWO2_01_FULL_45_10]
MEKIVSLAKRRGFVFPSSEIYGGINSIYDFGPLGVELKNNIKREWWKTMVQLRADVVGLDSGILMHPKIWEASGHVAGFSDPLVDCKSCKKRFRADHLLEGKGMKPDFRPQDFKKAKVRCPECDGELTEVRDFNLMFKTFMGALENEASEIYLRPETAQGIYVNFQNVLNASRQSVPFGIAQIGKAFRNEITPGNFIFRTREFEQMEMQFFVNPKEVDKWFDYWQKERLNWYRSLGLNKENLKSREHQSRELAHYAKKAADVEYAFPFGQSELEGVHNRGDFDLSRHQKYSGKDLTYFNAETKEKFIPYVIETSGGVERSLLAFLVDAYTEVDPRSGDEESKHEKEVILKLDKRLAPIKAAILPLSKKLEKEARQIYLDLQASFMCQFDASGAIGRRYRRQDEIGTPFCLTFDFESLNDKKITVRDRDTMKQERVAIGELKDYLREQLGQ